MVSGRYFSVREETQITSLYSGAHAILAVDVLG